MGAAEGQSRTREGNRHGVRVRIPKANVRDGEGMGALPTPLLEESTGAVMQ